MLCPSVSPGWAHDQQPYRTDGLARTSQEPGLAPEPALPRRFCKETPRGRGEDFTTSRPHPSPAGPPHPHPECSALLTTVSDRMLTPLGQHVHFL